MDVRSRRNFSNSTKRVPHNSSDSLLTFDERQRGGATNIVVRISDTLCNGQLNDARCHFESKASEDTKSHHANDGIAVLQIALEGIDAEQGHVGLATRIAAYSTVHKLADLQILVTGQFDDVGEIPTRIPALGDESNDRPKPIETDVVPVGLKLGAQDIVRQVYVPGGGRCAGAAAAATTTAACRHTCPCAYKSLDRLGCILDTL